jgi:hypothetical protein
MTTDDDRLVAEYLLRLRSAASVLPADRASELIEEITAHIAEARAEAPAAPAGSASVRNILDRLGDPADIVQAAAEQLREGPAVPGLAAASRPWPGSVGVRASITVLLLLIGGIVIPVIGWVAGVVLLWTSRRWCWREKLLGTLVWPGGLLAPLVLLAIYGFAPTTVSTCSPGSPEVTLLNAAGQVIVQHAATAPHCSGPAGPPWLVIAIAAILMAAAIAGPIFTAVRLLRGAEGTEAEAAAEPAALQPV